MNKYEAIKYLVENNVYNDEWSGAGMYVAIAEIVEAWDNATFTKEQLDEKLKKAENF